MQHCDSTCPYCANEFWKWVKSRLRSRPKGRSGPGDFYKEAATSIKPEDNGAGNYTVILYRVEVEE